MLGRQVNRNLVFAARAYELAQLNLELVVQGLKQSTVLCNQLWIVFVVRAEFDWGDDGFVATREALNDLAHTGRVDLRRADRIRSYIINHVNKDRGYSVVADDLHVVDNVLPCRSRVLVEVRTDFGQVRKLCC